MARTRAHPTPSKLHVIAAPTRLYHLPRSRSSRALWALEEIGVPFEVTVMTGADRKSEAHIARHALGRVPVIEDDAGHLFESAAIVLALADRHTQAGLNFPLGTRERELVYQWVLFAMAELEPPIVEARDQRESDPARANVAAERFSSRAALLERALEGREFLVADRFSAADIVVGSVAGFARRVELLAEFPEINRYIDALAARPAFQRANAPA
jgi:glutathione S-transferase